MSKKNLSIKEQINFYDFFKDEYFKIIDELKFDHKEDCKARDLLSTILKLKKEIFSYDLDIILRTFKVSVQSRETIFIYGCGPSLEPTIEWILESQGNGFFENKINITADGASRLLKKKHIPIQAIFTDLDGITRAEFNYPEYIIIHGHGDNIDKLEYFKQDILKFMNIIGTTQVEPLYNLVNPGGFTDGDRILYFLRSLLLPSQKIFLIGMDFKNIIGKYSKPHLTANQESGPIKNKKLKLAVQLIEQIIPSMQNEIFFVNTHKISNKFQYLSLEDLIREV